MFGFKCLKYGSHRHQCSVVCRKRLNIELNLLSVYKYLQRIATHRLIYFFILCNLRFRFFLLSLSPIKAKKHIWVNLQALGEEEFYRILTEPQNALIRQYTALLATEGIELEFSDEAIHEMARLAMQVNQKTEDIDARRLHTVIERVLDEISFDAPEREGRFVVEADYVRQRLEGISGNEDLSRYIL